MATAKKRSRPTARASHPVDPTQPIDPSNGSAYPRPILPQVVDSARHCSEYQYAAKLVSGLMSKDNQGIVAPGAYLTAVNVHNPSTCRTVTFRWKVAVARPVGQPFGAITRFQKVTLRPDQAVEIDAPNVARALDVGLATFVKGFVVLECPCELDVVAVYTAGAPNAAGQPGNLAVLEVERVPARRIDACRDDLTADLSTGVAAWTLVSAVNLNGSPLPGIVTPRTANVIELADKHPAWGNQPPSHWISIRGAAQNMPAGFYTFQWCFTLCSSFENARIDLTYLSDDRSIVWLNDTAVDSGGSLTAPRSLSITSQSLFLPGLNCLSFVVRNDHNPPVNPVGLNVLGKVTALRGVCGDGCGCCCGEGGDVVYPHPHLPLDPVAEPVSDSLPG
jgi:hypothetical protein